jgi:hypothetical protein
MEEEEENYWHLCIVSVFKPDLLPSLERLKQLQSLILLGLSFFSSCEAAVTHAHY